MIYRTEGLNGFFKVGKYFKLTLPIIQHGEMCDWSYEEKNQLEIGYMVYLC